MSPHFSARGQKQGSYVKISMAEVWWKICVTELLTDYQLLTYTTDNYLNDDHLNSFPANSFV
jgi:hypothetical protein